MDNSTYSKLVFLIFRPRSGSTFFADRMGRHPDILVTPESKVGRRLYDFFEQGPTEVKDFTVQEVIEFIYGEKKFRDWKLPKEYLVNELNEEKLTWYSVFSSICEAYRKWKKPGAKIIAFKKSGWYAENLDMLFHVFPNSLAISVVRDPRAVFNSARKALHSETGEPLAENVVKNAFGWKKFIAKNFAVKNKYTDRLIFVRYESMLEDLKKVVTEAWDFVGIESLHNDKIKELLQTERNSHLVTSSTEHLHENVSKAPIPSFADKWKKELPSWKSCIIKFICRREMARFDYK